MRQPPRCDNLSDDSFLIDGRGFRRILSLIIFLILIVVTVIGRPLLHQSLTLPVSRKRWIVL